MSSRIRMEWEYLCSRKKAPGPLSPIGAKIGLGTIALGSTIAGVKAIGSKIKAKKVAKKAAASVTSKPTTSMKLGGKRKQF